MQSGSDIELGEKAIGSSKVYPYDGPPGTVATSNGGSDSNISDKATNSSGSRMTSKFGWGGGSSSTPASDESNDRVKQKMGGKTKSLRNLLSGDEDTGGKERTLLGTFKGVFVPTAQNVLGVIFFIRLPWITGQAGIGETLGIVGISCLCTTLTSISMSAIATNGKIEGGGSYSIIRKSLGPEFGGTVGLLLFISNTFGVAMYCFGAVEVLDNISSDIAIDKDNNYANKVVLGSVVLVFLTSIVFVGIKYIARFAVLFLTGVLLSIFSIFLGAIVRTAQPLKSEGIVGLGKENFEDNWASSYDDDWSFAQCLALFYPAVTDPLAGSNLSGDLKDPTGSIPKGTLFAVLFTSIIFVLQVIFQGGGVLRQTLKDNYFVVTDMAWPFGEVIYGGVLVSTLGAGLQSLAGAPRLMQAIAKDNVISQLSIFKCQPGEEPRRALLLTYSISQCAILLGGLDMVAPFITMFFLTCYAIMNGACFLLAYEKSPSFRPRFHYFHWSLSLAGLLTCLALMFMIHWGFALIVLSTSLGLYKYCQYVKAYQESGGQSSGGSDWSSGIRFQQVRKWLLALEGADFELKYWRPFVLFLCEVDGNGEYKRQKGMINLISQIMYRGKGIAVMSAVIPGEYREKVDMCANGSQNLKDALRASDIEGFASCITATTKMEGLRHLIQGNCFTSLKPNTVMLGLPVLQPISPEGSRPEFGEMLEPETGDKLLAFMASAEFKFNTVGQALPEKSEKLPQLPEGAPDPAVPPQSSPWPAGMESPKSGGQDPLVLPGEFKLDRHTLRQMEVTAKQYVELLDDITHSGKSVLICTGASDFLHAGEYSSTIDVWWLFDILPAKGLLLLLPYLLMFHKCWKKCEIRLLLATSDSEDQEDMQELLVSLLEKAGLADKIREVKIVICSEEEALPFMHFDDQGNLHLPNMDAAASLPSDATSTPLSRDGDLSQLSEKVERFSSINGGSSIPKDETKYLGKRRSIIQQGTLQALDPASPSPPGPDGEKLPEKVEEDKPLTGEVEPQAPQEGEANKPEPSTQPKRRRNKQDSAMQSLKRQRYRRQILAGKRQSGFSTLNEAMSLNKKIQAESGSSSLVVMNMPKMLPGQSDLNYLMCINKLIAGLPRVIAVKESGQERIELYS